MTRLYDLPDVRHRREQLREQLTIYSEVVRPAQGVVI
jgi:hypothetical protein